MSRPSQTALPSTPSTPSTPTGAAEPGPGDDAPAGTPGTGEAVCRCCGGSGRMADGQACAECGGTGRVTQGIGGG
jgi:hypothetical protein